MNVLNRRGFAAAFFVAIAKNARIIAKEKYSLKMALKTIPRAAGARQRKNYQIIPKKIGRSKAASDFLSSQYSKLFS